VTFQQSSALAGLSAIELSEGEFGGMMQNQNDEIWSSLPTA
jgi:hypothetical protein